MRFDRRSARHKARGWARGASAPARMRSGVPDTCLGNWQSGALLASAEENKFDNVSRRDSWFLLLSSNVLNTY